MYSLLWNICPKVKNNISFVQNIFGILVLFGYYSYICSENLLYLTQ